MKKIIIINILVIFCILKSYTASLEFNDYFEYNKGHSYTYTKDSGEKTSDYIFNPIGINKHLFDITKEYPELKWKLKAGNAMLWTGAINLGIGIGLTVSGLLVPIEMLILDYLQSGYNTWQNYYDNKKNYANGLFILGAVCLGVGIPFLIAGILLMVFYNKPIKKAFELFNESERKKDSISLYYTNDKIGVKIPL